MKTEYSLLVSLVREAICESSSQATLKRLDPEQLPLLPNVVKIAKEHDVLPVLAEALERYEIPNECSEIKEKLTKYKFVSVFRATSILTEQTSLIKTLSDADIPFVLLKGAVIREYYPEPWMRTSSDIDILLPPEDIEGAMALLKDKLEYSYICRSPHDVSLKAPSGVHIELHFMLIEASRDMEKSTEILDKVWDYTVKSQDSSQYFLCDEMYYFYHIAHMAKHFINGGCGLRSFIDLWLMDNKMAGDREKRIQLLTDGNLITFATHSSALASVWLDGAEHTEITRKIEQYILPAGVYGGIDNMVALRTGKRGGKFRYLLSRIFVPYEDLKNRYPEMAKHKILIPFLQVRRWISLLNIKKIKRVRSELKSVGDTDSSRLDNATDLLKILKI